MKDLITKSQEHLLWYDESEETFLLLKFGEVFRYSQDVLRLHVLKVETVLLLRKMEVVLNEIKTDDGFYILDVHKKDLPAIIALGAFKRRPDVNGRWVKQMEKRLAHFLFSRKPCEKTRLAKLEARRSKQYTTASPTDSVNLPYHEASNGRFNA